MKIKLLDSTSDSSNEAGNKNNNNLLGEETNKDLGYIYLFRSVKLQQDISLKESHNNRLLSR